MRELGDRAGEKSTGKTHNSLRHNRLD